MFGLTSSILSEVLVTLAESPSSSSLLICGKILRFLVRKRGRQIWKINGTTYTGASTCFPKQCSCSASTLPQTIRRLCIHGASQGSEMRYLSNSQITFHNMGIFVADSEPGLRPSTYHVCSPFLFVAHSTK
jgi:hypothetical protein